MTLPTPVMPMPLEGERVEVTVGPVAHGGHCVARVGDAHGPVLFVRHALPGERVIAEVTEVHRGFGRADAVTVLEASADRVTPPCPYARPGACGGCDLQHVAPPAQREWKAAVVREQLTRLAGLSSEQVDALAVRVEAVPGGMLGWRSRVRYAVDAAGRPGLLKHRSHEVVPIERCLIADPAIQELPVLGQRWPTDDVVEAVASSTGEVTVLATPVTGPASPGAARTRVVEGTGELRERVAGRDWVLPAEAFWQVHHAAAEALAGAVRELIGPQPGESVWDLYGGAGLFAGALAEAVGPAARITVVEAAPRAVAAAHHNLSELPGVEVVAARVETALARRRLTGPVDLVVLDPPRSGAGARVVAAIASARPRAVAYVACDPAAFARDVRSFAEAGWRLAALRAYDIFPMTQHVECVGLFLPNA